ncbi:tetratricopeptide repeat protein [Embleya sp. NBC_00896]|uniref:tetratricopeptide repeat protein n=1 Tax=Embleya sp. NBC_00896 TaxID=2975961 RepID=UPI0038666602|nr:tetratricopeptide repeat protein [Embleya sp. NBC_00896]
MLVDHRFKAGTRTDWGTAVPDTRRIIDGRYELLERLGRGGMGEVWTAHDPRLNRTVAIKLLAKADDPAAEIMFVREAKAASTFNHPNVVTIYDAGGGAEGEPMYLVMERLHGQDLAHSLRQGLPTIDRIIDWTRQICAALEAAQAVNLVHRDLKPANLFLTREGRIKVLDFGLARTYAAFTATASATIGTAPYMAPERWLGRVGDHRGDLYSLGCILHELLTGERPFGNRDASGQMYAHLHEQPRPPVVSCPDIPPDLNRLVLDLLAKSPDERPDNATTTRTRLPPTTAETRLGEQHMEAAQRLKVAGHADQAERAYRRALAVHAPAAAFRLAAHLADLDRGGEAEELYRHALADGDPSAAIGLAALLERRGRVNEAEEALRRALADGHPDAVHSLPLLLERLDRVEEAEELYRRALAEEHPFAAMSLARVLVKLGRVEEAEELYRRALTKGSIGVTYNLAKLLADLGRVEEAEELYRRALAEGRQHAADNLAYFLSKRGRVEEAEELYRRALDEGSPGVACELAHLLKEGGRIEEAEELFRRGLADGDERASAYLGGLLVELGRVEEAENVYRRALAKDQPYVGRDLTKLLVDLGRVEEAEELYRSALANGYLEAGNCLADLFVELGRVGEAEKLYRSLLADGYKDASNSLAILLEKSGRVGEAEVFRRAFAGGHKDGAYHLKNLRNESEALPPSEPQP